MDNSANGMRRLSDIVRLKNVAVSLRRIVYQPLCVRTSYALPSMLPNGRYQTWLRAIRAENGQLYAGALTSVLFDLV